MTYKLTYKQYYPQTFEVRKPYKAKRNKNDGFNDAPYVVELELEGKRFKCPAYRKWCSTLDRAYCPKFQAENSTYIGTQVCKEWRDSFMAFRKWFFAELSKTDLEPGKAQVDKDLLTNSKLYSPKTCILIPNSLNNLLSDHGNDRGDLPQGVTIHGTGYQAQVCTSDGRKSKSFRTVPEAFDVYVKAKTEVIKSAPIPYWLDEDKIRRRLLTIFRRQMEAQRIEFANVLNTTENTNA